MKIIKTASGKKSIKISKNEWQSIGKKAGWDQETKDGYEEHLDRELDDSIRRKEDSIIDDEHRDQLMNEVKQGISSLGNPLYVVALVEKYRELANMKDADSSDAQIEDFTDSIASVIFEKLSGEMLRKFDISDVKNAIEDVLEEKLKV